MPTRHNHSPQPFALDTAEIEEKLRQMEADASLITVASFSANTSTYPDHSIPFVEKHMAYLKGHPKVNPEHYLANLRLMIKIR